MTDSVELPPRSLSLTGATLVGVGAIVGGGILALAGIAFATAGPSAILAFALNGLIALLTALTFAEMATSFPESGGTYTFAKKVLSVEVAFLVGWVVWFASIVAAVLYGLGFGAFARILVVELWPGGAAPIWVRGPSFGLALALVATGYYTFGLVRRQGGGGRWETIGKLLVFVFLILVGLAVFPTRDPVALTGRLIPFFAFGGAGLLQAMGYTFIALQGFDLIAAVGGEVKDPARNLPRALVGSLVIALVIYIPLLFLVSTLGVPEGTTIGELAAADPEAVVANAVEQYLGRTGFWLVILAALLSMLSALQANLLAASHIALAMARDRNLPPSLRLLDPARGTPRSAVLATSAMVGGVLILTGDVAAAGAMSSLIFLLSFAVAHWTSILTRRRGGGRDDAFLLPWFPAIPVVGGLACLGLAVFQGFAVPAAGAVGAGWLAIGGLLYAFVFSPRARVADAAAEALDPQLARLRGRAPLVLVPIANPARAEALVTVASALAPPPAGRVLLLYVVETPASWSPGEVPPQLLYAQQVLAEALTTSFAASRSPEALTTISPDPWGEICRVAASYGCESLLLGLGTLDEAPGQGTHARLLELLATLDCDVVLLRAPDGWRLDQVRRVLVPVGGRRDQSHLRARLLGSLQRGNDLEVVYLGIVGPGVDRNNLEREVRRLAEDEVPGSYRVEISDAESVIDAVVEASRTADLVILGLRREGRRGRAFGDIPVRVAQETQGAVLMIGSR